MRYNPSTDRARNIEDLVAQSRRAIANAPEPTPLGYVWSPTQLSYVSSN